jgi:hypothetical protein
MPFGISANLQRVKQIAMAIAGSLIVIATICGSLIPLLAYHHKYSLPQPPQLREGRSLDQLPPDWFWPDEILGPYNRSVWPQQQQQEERQQRAPIAAPLHLRPKFDDSTPEQQLPWYYFRTRPEHPVIQHNLDKYHTWIDYGSTLPPLANHSGIPSVRPYIRGGGWINGLTTKQLVYTPYIIADYNGCLSRALYSAGPFPKFHPRLTLCPHPPYNKRTGRTGDIRDDMTVDIRMIASNHNGDLKSTDRGIALSFDQYVSLVKMFKFVESYMQHYEELKRTDPLLMLPPHHPDVPERKIRFGLDVDQGADVLYRNQTTRRNITSQGDNGTGGEQVENVGSTIW